VQRLLERGKIECAEMKLKIFFIIALFFVLPGALSSQERSASEILEKSKAKLIIVGKLSNYGRTYHEYPSEFYDSTIARYEVVQVLKGDYRQKSIEITFEGHLYLSDKNNHILFLTDDKSSLGLTKEFSNCRGSSCYLSDVDWILEATSKNILTVEKLLAPDSTKTNDISEEEAVKLAEEFIKANGYTTFRPVPDKKKITLESIEWTADVKEILKKRYNSLEPKAYGIGKGLKTKNDGFTVIFRYKDVSIKDVGRAVTMDSNGKNLRVQHKDIFLKAAEKIF
jgi:hypothetical protein